MGGCISSVDTIQPKNHPILQREFPPQYSSLCSDVSKLDMKDELMKKYNQIFITFPQTPGCGWTKIGQVMDITSKGGPKLFQNPISPQDIRQGEFQTSYFLAALAALAEWEPRVRKLFNSDQPNPDGSYDVNIFCDGQKQKINVDDYFPTKENGQSLIGATSENGTIWHIILEKAYAKFYGSYSNIISGNPCDALRDLTGAPSFKYFLNASVDPSSQIMEANKKNHVMTASTIQDESIRALGLQENHSYTLLDAATVTDSTGKKHRIVQLRNPWGHFEWKGDWGDQSSCWTDEWKQKLNVKAADDGLFWISFTDFKKYFYSFDVCHYDEKSSFSSTEPLKFGKDGDYKFIKIKISNAGSYTFTCCLRPNRNQVAGKKYEGIRFQLVKLSNGKDFQGKCEKIKIQSSYGKPPLYTYQIQRNKLQEGEYLALIDPDISKLDNSDFPLIFNAYGPGNVAFQDVTSEFIKNGWGLQDFVANSYHSLFKKNPELFTEATISDANKPPETIKLWDYEQFDGYGIYILKNSDKQAKITQKIKWKITEGYILPPCKDEQKYFKTNGANMEIASEPGTELTVVVRLNLEDGEEQMEEKDFVLN